MTEMTRLCCRGGGLCFRYCQWKNIWLVVWNHGLLWLSIWLWINTYRYIFSGMNIHLPAILMFTRGTRFWHTAIYWECHHPNWRSPSFFRGVGQPPTRWFLMAYPNLKWWLLTGGFSGCTLWESIVTLENTTFIDDFPASNDWLPEGTSINILWLSYDYPISIPMWSLLNHINTSFMVFQQSDVWYHQYY